MVNYMGWETYEPPAEKNSRLKRFNIAYIIWGLSIIIVAAFSYYKTPYIIHILLNR